VFQRCQQTWLQAGMAGAFAAGFAAQEIASAIQLCGLTATPDLADQVRAMGSVAAGVLNERKA
jgi:hypothetical protein